MAGEVSGIIVVKFMLCLLTIIMIYVFLLLLSFSIIITTYCSHYCFVLIIIGLLLDHNYY